MTRPSSSNSIRLASGGLFDFTNPEASLFTIHDIAVGLANTCRYAGQFDDDMFYSVAEHSVLVSLMVPHEYAWPALMHDAAEAFTGDLVSPLKRLLPAFTPIETRIERAIAARFDVPYPWHPAVKKADDAIVPIEKAALRENLFDPHVFVRALQPLAAKKLFLARYAELRLEYRT